MSSGIEHQRNCYSERPVTQKRARPRRREVRWRELFDERDESLYVKGAAKSKLCGARTSAA